MFEILRDNNGKIRMNKNVNKFLSRDQIDRTGLTNLQLGALQKTYENPVP